MRVSRQWTHLMDLKQAGVNLAPGQKDLGDLTLGCQCPACPLPGVTFQYGDLDNDEL